MVNSAYANAAADIIKVSAAGDTVEGQQHVSNLCQVFQEFLYQFTSKTDGYMFVAAFMVSFGEMKRVIDAAQGGDKVLLEQLMKAIIGSFGSTVQ